MSGADTPDKNIHPAEGAEPSNIKNEAAGALTNPKINHILSEEADRINELMRRYLAGSKKEIMADTLSRDEKSTQLRQDRPSYNPSDTNPNQGDIGTASPVRRRDSPGTKGNAGINERNITQPTNQDNNTPLKGVSDLLEQRNKATVDDRRLDHIADPLVEPINRALQSGNKEQALEHAEKIAEEASKEKTIGGQKYGGKNSLDHAYALYKIAEEFSQHRDWATSEQYYKEGIRATEAYFANPNAIDKSQLHKAHDISQLLAKQYMGAGTAAEFQGHWSDSVDHYKEAAKIYENIYKAQGDKMGIELLSNMMHCYYSYGGSVLNKSYPVKTAEYHRLSDRFDQLAAIRDKKMHSD